MEKVSNLFALTAAISVGACGFGEKVPKQLSNPLVLEGLPGDSPALDVDWEVSSDLPEGWYIAHRDNGLCSLGTLAGEDNEWLVILTTNLKDVSMIIAKDGNNYIMANSLSGAEDYTEGVVTQEAVDTAIEGADLLDKGFCNEE